MMTAGTTKLLMPEKMMYKSGSVIGVHTLSCPETWKKDEGLRALLMVSYVYRTAASRKERNQQKKIIVLITLQWLFALRTKILHHVLGLDAAGDSIGDASQTLARLPQLCSCEFRVPTIARFDLPAYGGSG